LIGEIYSGHVADSFATGSVRTDRSEYLLIKNGYYAGGFVGYMVSGLVENSYATGDVTSSGDNAGGFAGGTMEGSIIRDSYATGDVTGLEETLDQTVYRATYVGGFVGNSIAATFTDAYATGNVSTPGDYVGGFVGRNDCVSTFTRSYATGDVSGTNLVGGFIGQDTCEGPAATFTQTSATGNVTATGEIAGGFAGQLGTSIVHDSYAAGNVSGTIDVGGFAGQLGYAGEITRSYSRGAVSGTDSGTTGGFIGTSDETSTVWESFWNSETAGELTTNNPNGKTTDEMMSFGLFVSAGWDFDTVWASESGMNGGYPFFSYFLGPYITDITPGEADSGRMGNTAPIVIDFSVPVNAELVEVTVTSCGDSCPELESEWSNGNRRLTLTKSVGSFAYGTSFIVEIDNVESEGGVEAESLPYSFSFTIESEPQADNAVVVTPVRQSGSSFARRVQNLQSMGNVPAAEQLKALLVPSATISVPAGPSVIQTVSRDLKAGMTSSDVAALQQFLVQQAKGPAAKALRDFGRTTTFFGPLTKSALAEWQKANDIVPSSGYFGPLTRGKIKLLGL
jgi:hypothetical protein